MNRFEEVNNLIFRIADTRFYPKNFELFHIVAKVLDNCALLVGSFSLTIASNVYIIIIFIIGQCVIGSSPCKLRSLFALSQVLRVAFTSVTRRVTIRYRARVFCIIFATFCVCRASRGVLLPDGGGPASFGPVLLAA